MNMEYLYPEVQHANVSREHEHDKERKIKSCLQRTLSNSAAITSTAIAKLRFNDPYKVTMQKQTVSLTWRFNNTPN
ncbi:MAG TPA: hypothetical protein VEB42_00650 [Chitinophagaceae bacterium]|nr:hypothetical protein [Chitinophagaceae bacterium]